MERWTLVSESLLGDLLLSTPAIHALRQAKPEARIRYCHSDGKPSWQLLEGNPDLDALEIVPAGGSFTHEPDERVVPMSCTAAFTWGSQHGRTLAEGFGPQLGVEVTDLRYVYHMTPEEEARGRELAEELGEGRPVVLVARHSASCTSNDPRIRRPNKCCNAGDWARVAKWLLKEGMVPVAVGAKGDLQDSRYHEWPGKKLYGAPLREVAALQRAAAATLSVDTGMRHLGTAAAGNVYCISCAIPLSLIRCVPVREGQKIYEEHRPLEHVNAGTLVAGAKQVLS